MRPQVRRWKAWSDKLRNSWHKGLLVLVIIGIVVAMPLPALAQESRAYSTAPPRSLLDQMHAKFPGWRPEEVSDLGTDDHQLWLEAHPKECPGIAVGHFKDPSAVSYALLLLRESNPAGGYKLLIAKKNSRDTYEFDLLDNNDTQSAAGTVISRAKPGKFSDFEQTESVDIKLDAVDVESIEKKPVCCTTGRVGSIVACRRPTSFPKIKRAALAALPIPKLNSSQHLDAVYVNGISAHVAGHSHMVSFVSF